MGYVDSTVVERIKSGDGNRLVEMIQRPDGVCRFVEHALSYDRIAGDYWRETHHSGLYADLQTAKADAAANIPWLRART